MSIDQGICVLFPNVSPTCVIIYSVVISCHLEVKENGFFISQYSLTWQYQLRMDQLEDFIPVFAFVSRLFHTCVTLSLSMVHCVTYCLLLFPAILLPRHILKSGS